MYEKAYLQFFLITDILKLVQECSTCREDRIAETYGKDY
jgi:hypothetical protein